MKLSELSAPLRIVRDGAFASLGFVSYTTDALLVFIESEEYLAELARNPKITAVITSEALADKIPASMALAISAQPRADFYAIHSGLAATDFYWPSFDSTIAASAKVHPRAYVAEKNVRIGERCVIEPNVTILERVILGDDVIVRAGTVLGSEGAQFIYAGGGLIGVKHAGGVRIGNRVEIQALCTVDVAMFGGFTEVGDDCKFDDHVHVAHNVRLGKRNRLLANAMLAGSITSGDDVWFGPSCSIADGVTVGDRASITIGSVVTRDLPADAKVSGNFAIDHQRFIAHIKAIR